MVYFVGVANAWVFIFLAIYVLGLVMMKPKEGLFQRAIVLCLGIVFIQTQSFWTAQVGLTPHAKLQKFAQRVNAENKGAYRLGVGSHDIHEKEWQVYFDDRLIEKAADKTFDLTHMRIHDFLLTSHGAFLLLTRKDYNIHLQELYHGPMAILESEFLVRRRMKVDSQFFKALASLNRAMVKDYLMEEILLVRIDNAS